MAVPESPTPAKLIVSVMTSESKFFDRAATELETFYGPVDATSSEIRDEHFEFYHQEMGRGLFKVIVAFERLIDPGTLAPIKMHTNTLEMAFSVRGQRAVNLDPGYITSGNLVLASAKPRPRRVYLRDGIHAELELVYQSHEFKPLPWTFPSYQQPAVLRFLQQVREAYLEQLKG